MRALVWIVSAMVLAVSGCKLNTDYFSDYRGVNILANSDFSTAKWSLAAPNYMTLQDAGTTGPDGTSRAYRLSVNNLMPNGDFQDSTTNSTWQTELTTAGYSTADLIWSSVQDYTPFSAVLPSIMIGISPTTGSSPAATSATALGWAAINVGEALRLNMKNAVGSTLWPTSGSSIFRIWASLYNTSSNTSIPIVPLTSSNTATSNTLATPDWTLNTTATPTLYEWTQAFTSNATVNEPEVTEFGSLATARSAVTFQSVRIVPDDKTLVAKLVFSSLKSGSLPLLPGSGSGVYTFSVYVKDDPNAGSNNIFLASAITISVQADVNSGSPTYVKSVTRADGGWSSSWQKVSVSMGFDFVSQDPTDGTAVLTIAISPTYSALSTAALSGYPDAASLLVSEPSLTFNP